MNITRDNYEMYFLLYVDNELSALEKEEVDLFVCQNHDLSRELELLKGTLLTSEEQIFIPKTLLYKNATRAESVQQSLLLHLDNELSEADAATVKSQIASDADIEAEWLILQKTRIYPDKIVYKFKRSLYRHSDKVFYMRIWRAAAAAVIIGAGIYIAVSLSDKDLPGDTIAITKSNNPAKQVIKDILTTDSNKNINYTEKDPVAITSKNPNSAEKTLDANEQKNNIADKIIIAKKQESNIQKAVLNNINKDERNETVLQNVKDKEAPEIDKKNIERDLPVNDIVVVSPPEKDRNMNTPITDTEISVMKESVASLVNFDETSTNNRFLYMDEEKVNRSKIGVLFRKVKRVVERNTKIKTSNGLRIGGFEFAVK